MLDGMEINEMILMKYIFIKVQIFIATGREQNYSKSLHFIELSNLNFIILTVFGTKDFGTILILLKDSDFTRYFRNNSSLKVYSERIPNDFEVLPTY